MRLHTGAVWTVRESALKADWEKNPLLHWGLKPASALSTELSLLLYIIYKSLQLATELVMKGSDSVPFLLFRCGLHYRNIFC